MMLGVEWSKARLRGRPRTIRPLAAQSSLDTSSQWLRAAANVMPNGSRTARFCIYRNKN